MKKLYKKLSETFDVEIVGNKIKMLKSPSDYGLRASDIFDITKQYGYTISYNSGNWVIEKGYPCPQEVVESYLDMEDYLEDSILK